MKYSPECVAEFEALAEQNRWDTGKDEAGYYFEQSTAIALAAFAANWERVRELENMVKKAWLDGLGTGAAEQSQDSPRPTASELWNTSTTRELLEKGNE